MNTFGSVKVDVTLEGKSPLLMHRKNPDVMTGDIDMKSLSPEEQAALVMYVNGDNEPVIPVGNIVGALYDVTPGQTWPGRGKTGLSRLIPLIDFEGENYPIFDPATGKNGKEPEGVVHSVWAVIGRGGAMRHRPLFWPWAIDFKIGVMNGLMGLDKKEATKLVRGLFDAAGIVAGLMDWRPSKKGTFGKFQVTRFELVEEK